MSDKQSRRRTRRWLLWLADPRCHWCGVETVFVYDAPKKTGEKLIAEAATLDHLITRRVAESLDAYSASPVVLACHACNQRRNDQEAMECHLIGLPAIYKDAVAGGQRRITHVVHRSPLETRAQWRSRVAQISESLRS